MLGNSRTSFRYHWLDWFVSWTGQQVRVGVLLKIGGGGHLQGLPTVYQTVSMRNQSLQQETSGKKAIQGVRNKVNTALVECLFGAHQELVLF